MSDLEPWVIVATVIPVVCFLQIAALVWVQTMPQHSADELPETESPPLVPDIARFKPIRTRVRRGSRRG